MAHDAPGLTQTTHRYWSAATCRAGFGRIARSASWDEAMSGKNSVATRKMPAISEVPENWKSRTREHSKLPESAAG